MYKQIIADDALSRYETCTRTNNWNKNGNN